MREYDLYEALRKRYSPPEWAIFRHVGNATGAQLQGWADAVAMNLWPSRGLTIHGFEVKVDRRDWLTELANPAKAENVARYCDFWWLVVSDKDIVQPGELPETWGLLVAGARGGLRAHIEPKRTEAPQDVPREFLAAVLRRANEVTVDQMELNTARQNGYEQGVKDTEQRALREATDELNELLRLRDVLNGIETEIGIPLSEVFTRYGRTGKEFGEAVRIVMAARRDMKLADKMVLAAAGDAKTAMDYLVRLSQTFKQIDAAIGALK